MCHAAFAIAALVALIVAGGAAYHGGVALPDNERVELVRQRVERSIPESDDTLMGRGYTTILDHPGFLPFGAGEGNFSALTRDADGAFHPGEVHSTLGAILLAYGIVGLGLFLAFLFDRGTQRRAYPQPMVAPQLYLRLRPSGVAKFPLFWILLSACVTAVRCFSTVATSANSPSRSRLPAPCS